MKATEIITMFANRCHQTKERLRQQYTSMAKAQELIDGWNVQTLEDALHAESVSLEQIRLRLEEKTNEAEQALAAYCIDKVESNGWLSEKHRTEEYKTLKKAFDARYKALQVFNANNPIKHTPRPWRNK